MVALLPSTPPLRGCSKSTQGCATSLPRQHRSIGTALEDTGARVENRGGVDGEHPELANTSKGGA